LPDPRRLYRRVTQSNLPTRLIAHVSVVSLVAVAALTGLNQAQRPSTVDGGTDFLTLVQRVRGAADATTAPETLTFAIGGMPADEAAELDRNQRVSTGQVATAPMATPVPVDPDATPLPGPENVGTTDTASARTTRQQAPAAPAVVRSSGRSRPAASASTTTPATSPSTSRRRTGRPSSPRRAAPSRGPAGGTTAAATSSRSTTATG